MLVDYYLRILHLDRRMPLNFDLGPLHIHLYARSVFLMWITVGILVIAGIAVFASRRRELIQKWTTWALIAPVVGIPIWIGRGTTAVLAAVLAVVAVIEYARLVKTEQGRHRLAAGAGRAVSARGVAAPVSVGPRADRRAGVCAALGVQR